MTASERFDTVVIGSGQAGTPLSMALAKSGQRTALVERTHVGGTCVNDGCTPTKTMVASARVAELTRRSATYGTPSGPTRIDMSRIRQRKREIVERFRAGSEKGLAKTPNLELIRGEARFSSPTSVTVQLQDGSGTREISASRFFINAGTRPAIPAIDGIGEVPFLDSTSVMELASVPEHLLVLGGGYVGLEFGQMFRRFGARVTIVQSSGRLLPREDPDVADAVAALLREDGIDVLLDGHATKVTGSGAGVRLTVSTGGAELVCDGSHLLLAAGRVPNTEALNLAAAGVATDRRGFITVTSALETSQPGIFALGDINGGPAFTHIAYDDYRILRTNLLEGGRASTEGRPVPYTVYIDPQLGRIGITEAEAGGRTIKVAKMPMTSVARALEVDETRGFIKVIVDAESDQILGAAVLGLEGGELMSMLQLAMIGKLTSRQLYDMVFAHPTIAESLNNLFAPLHA